MSILIKGMEMPKCCAECEWHEYYGGDYDWVHACRRTGTMPIENAETERANDCPLIEVPTPHGRLGDLDELIEKYGEWYTEEGTESGYIGTIKNLLDGASTVIEAEE